MVVVCPNKQCVLVNVEAGAETFIRTSQLLSKHKVEVNITKLNNCFLMYITPCGILHNRENLKYFELRP